MRKQHERLNLLYLLIRRCDRMIELDIEICGAENATLTVKYDRMRTRLYKAYAERLEYIFKTIIQHDK